MPLRGVLHTGVIRSLIPAYFSQHIQKHGVRGARWLALWSRYRGSWIKTPRCYIVRSAVLLGMASRNLRSYGRFPYQFLTLLPSLCSLKR